MSELQRKFDEALKKIARDYAKLNEGQAERAVEEITSLRLELIELINSYAKEDVVPRNRLNALLRDLETYEKTIREYASLTFTKIIEETVKWTTEQLTAVGLDIAFDYVNKHVLKYLLNREGEDGLILSDRVWNLAGDLRDELSKVIRSLVIRGASVSKLTKAIKEVHDNESWKIRRVAISEGNNAHRAGTLYSAQESEIVKAVQLVDNGHRHRNHSKHACYELSRVDGYGLGAGVYPLEDEVMARLISPHPQCSSRLRYIIKDEV